MRPAPSSISVVNSKRVKWFSPAASGTVPSAAASR
jgi:hypothetical protein